MAICIFLRWTFGCAPLKKCAWCGITIEWRFWHLISVIGFEIWTLKCYNIRLICTGSKGESQRNKFSLIFKKIFFTLYMCTLSGVFWAEFAPVFLFHASLQVKVFRNSNQRVTFDKIIFCSSFLILVQCGRYVLLL